MLIIKGLCGPQCQAHAFVLHARIFFFFLNFFNNNTFFKMLEVASLKHGVGIFTCESNTSILNPKFRPTHPTYW